MAKPSRRLGGVAASLALCTLATAQQGERPTVSEEVRALLEKGDTTAAWQVASREVEQRPEDPHAHVLAGSVLLHLPRLGKAREEFEQALKLDPSLKGVNAHLGDLAMARARELTEANSGVSRFHGGPFTPPKALKLFREAANRYAAELARSPGDLHCLRERALALEQVAPPEEIVAAHEAWIAADPRSVESFESLAGILTRYQAFERALALADRIPHDDPEGWLRAICELSDQFFMKGREGSALAVLDRLGDEGARSWKYHARRARILTRRLVLDKALESAERYVAMRPTPDSADHLDALVRLCLARFRAAPRILETYKISPPGSEDRPPVPLGKRLPRTDFPHPVAENFFRARVRVVLLVDEAGKVAETLVIPDTLVQGKYPDESPGTAREFEQAALKAFREWRFQPALRGGRACPALFVVHQDFRVKGFDYAGP